MLENPTEFNQSVEALLAAQKQAINSGSVAGGRHLCFMGNGNDDEDKYVNMVVSNFLQRKINFVSVALGGYIELKQTIEDPDMIVGTDIQVSRTKFTEDWVKKISLKVSVWVEKKPSDELYTIGSNSVNGFVLKTTENTSMMNKFSSVFRAKSFDIGGKLKGYINYSMAAKSPEVKKTTDPVAK